MDDFNNNRPPDDDNNLPDGVYPDQPPDIPGENAHLEGMPDFIKSAIDGLMSKIGATGGIAIPIGSIPKDIRDKICSMCPQMVEDEVADLDPNEMDEWNSINAETDRLLTEADKIHKALDRVDLRKSILSASLELKHEVIGKRLKIENGKLIRKYCDIPKGDKCNFNG